MVSEETVSAARPFQAAVVLGKNELLNPSMYTKAQRFRRGWDPVPLFPPRTLDRYPKRICHRFLMQTEESLSKGKQIMPETKFTECPALSVDPRVGISRSAMETDD